MILIKTRKQQIKTPLAITTAIHSE